MRAAPGSSPIPPASGGVPVPGEREHADRIAYGIPDVAGRDRSRYAGKRVLVVGSGHSAFNVILDLLTLAEQAPGTAIVWAMRRDSLDTVWGGGSADALEARGELGQRARRAVESGRIRVLTPFRIRSIARSGEALTISGAIRGDETAITVDQMVVCTGFRPDLEMLKEVRLSIDPWLECTSALGPLIDPNEHSCGTVRPHGARELAHAEKDFYIVGMKSYGRAPTFLLATGYEQARSVVAMLAGDVDAAERVELVLPETGVCSTTAVAGEAGCCGGPAPAEVDACCVADADAKAAGAERLRMRHARAGATPDRFAQALMSPRAIWTIGCGQLVNWGVLYYAFGVLLLPVEQTLNAPRWLVAGAFSLGLLVSAIAAPAVGRLADRGQGPAVMQAGGLHCGGPPDRVGVAADDLDHLPGWAGLGVCMAAILYEPVFAIVGRAYPDANDRLRAIATITVMGGLASTGFLPGTTLLVSRLGWRGAVVALGLSWPRRR